MNTDYIFQLFKDSIESKSDKEIEENIMNSAHWNLKMFIKYITNLKNFELKLLMLMKKASGEEMAKEKEEAEFLGFAKAFHHISRVNIHKKEHILDMDLVNHLDIAYCLQLTKSYLLSIEDYDKVAFLIELQDFVERRYENLEFEDE